MGTWGTAIFSNDLAADLRQDFKDCIAEKKTPAEAREILWKSNGFSVEDGENEDTREFWLVLSLIEWGLGRLEDCVKEKALEIISSGANVEDWRNLGAEPSEIKKRAVVLQELKQTLLSSQPEAKPIKKRPTNITPYFVGDVFYFRHLNGRYYLFQVVRHHKDKGGTYADAMQLNTAADSVEELSALDLEVLARRDVNRQLLTHWNGRHYAKLLKDNRLGLIGRRAVRLEETKGTTIKGSMITSFEYFDAGKRENLFDF